MHDLIRCIAGWLLGVLTPGSGKHRAGFRPVAESPTQRPGASRPWAVRLPEHRSPYGLHEPIDGAGTTLVRPYVLKAEHARESERQARRRIALVLAADFGIDLDRHVIGAEGVA